MTVAVGDICAAQEVIHGEVVATPLAPSRTLSELTGADVVIKFENLQYTACDRSTAGRLDGFSNRPSISGCRTARCALSILTIDRSGIGKFRFPLGQRAMLGSPSRDPKTLDRD